MRLGGTSVWPGKTYLGLLLEPSRQPVPDCRLTARANVGTRFLVCRPSLIQKFTLGRVQPALPVDTSKALVLTLK